MNGKTCSDVRSLAQDLPDRRADESRLFFFAGSGKTAMFTNLISLIPPRIHPVTGERADQVLVIVNSIQLATQTGEAIRRAYPDLVSTAPHTQAEPRS
jgi:superfamily II DNA or RNA helicase